MTGLNGPQALAMSPDGALLYAACEQSDSLVVFDVHPTDGTLSHRLTLQDEIGGVGGLDGAYAVATSIDGEVVYVAGFYDDALPVFQWESGVLVFKGYWTVFNGANAVVVSPDNKHVYLVSRLADTLAMFTRSSGPGLLTYLDSLQDGVDGVDGLDGARAIAISPDGKLVFVASQYEHALAVFARDASTGLLTYLGMHQDGNGIIEGLGAANGVAVSPDGGHVYVTGYDDDAVVTFARWRLFLPMVLR